MFKFCSNQQSLFILIRGWVCCSNIRKREGNVQYFQLLKSLVYSRSCMPWHTSSNGLVWHASSIVKFIVLRTISSMPGLACNSMRWASQGPMIFIRTADEYNVRVNKQSHKCDVFSEKVQMVRNSIMSQISDLKSDLWTHLSVCKLIQSTLQSDRRPFLL